MRCLQKQWKQVDTCKYSVKAMCCTSCTDLDIRLNEGIFLYISVLRLMEWNLDYEAESSKPSINCFHNDTIVLILSFSHSNSSIIVSVFCNYVSFGSQLPHRLFCWSCYIIGKCPPSNEILQQFISIYANFLNLLMQFLHFSVELTRLQEINAKQHIFLYFKCKRLEDLQKNFRYITQVYQVLT